MLHIFKVVRGILMSGISLVRLAKKVTKCECGYVNEINGRHYKTRKTEI
jgi:hypothetical protein